jgi:hypothetical protein
MDLQQHIAQAHVLGLHEDGYFHPECTICLTECAACYRAECHQILDGLGAELTEFDRWFDAIIAVDRSGLTMQEEPAILLAEFLGIELRDGDHNPAWQRIESVARPLRVKRLARTQHMSHDDQQVIEAIEKAEAALNDALFLAATKGILTRLDTGTSAIRHQTSQNWVKVAMWRKVNLRE